MKLLFISLAVTATLLAASVMIRRREINYSKAAIIAPNTAVESASDAGKRAPVVVELFTSEGCSSCPSADAALTQLVETQPVQGAEIIALSEHVDYWNYIGWADPFSSAAFSARQESYAGAFGSERIYTPQMIVDGQAEFVGSNLAKAREAVSTAARSPKAEINLTHAGTSENEDRLIHLKVNISKVPAINSGEIAEVLFAITENKLRSDVSRGENSGRKLSHTAVVRELRPIGKIDSAMNSYEAETAARVVDGWKRENLHALVFVQERKQRRILGAATLSLAAK